MAQLQAEKAYDINACDLNFYRTTVVETEFRNNANVQFGSKIYADVLRINAVSKFRDDILTLLGPDLTVNGLDQLQSGRVTAMAEHDFRASKGYGISGFSVAATAFESAMHSDSRTDDFALMEKIFAGNDTFYLSPYGDVAKGFAGDDRMMGYGGADRLSGSDGADNLYGGSGRDKISGGAGRDIIFGGSGADTLSGGASADMYAYNYASHGGDKINGFSRSDVIAVKGANFGSLPKGVLDPGRFVLGTSTAAIDTNDRFIFNVNDDKLWYDSNGTRSGGLSLIADLNIDFILTPNDILIL
jgi:Ca2+-binding RTX toxin-like protein